METVYLDIHSVPEGREACAVCVGYFDGLHRGHMQLVDKAIEEAQRLGCRSALFTFDPDPMVTLSGNTDTAHITPLPMKLELISKTSIDIVYILSFTPETAAMSHEDFSRFFLACIDARSVICGFDYRYGYRGLGNPHTLMEEMPCSVRIIDSVDEQGEKISSTRIISCSEKGNLTEASLLLGRHYCIQGQVVHGRGKGHLHGFPTANIKTDPEYVKPLPGVYGGWITVGGKRWKTMVNVGHNPTYNYRYDLSIEAYILDFNQDIYGQDVLLEFAVYLRPEQKFSSVEELSAQLVYDRERVRKELQCTQNPS
ncbi:MAG: riboflavin biosynthesis protein RibF [Solobacterium sp.]|nr:riboflavin biosynthesis protein RibF [Solobacterium sp.]